MFHECLGVVNAVPGEQGVCLGCLGVVFYCLGVFWGLLEGVSVLSEVSGSAFYSNLIYINCALIKSLTFSKRRGGPRCLKYQNVPTSRSFWPIGNPWERFQSWDIRVYFIPVPDDHTVVICYSSWLTLWVKNFGFKYFFSWFSTIFATTLPSSFDFFSPWWGGARMSLKILNNQWWKNNITKKVAIVLGMGGMLTLEEGW